MKRFSIAVAFLGLFFYGILNYGNTIFILFESTEVSRSSGKPNAGSMEFGKRLPTSGENFVTYSFLGSLIGRTHTNSKIRALVLEVYRDLETLAPGTCFVFGESAWKSGGRFWPHRTHKNGLSVDFFVPVLDNSGENTCLSTNMFNKLGYSIEFDSGGKNENNRIKFNSIALHLKSLNLKAHKYGLRIDRVIFENAYHKKLFSSAAGRYIQKNIKFTKFKPWVRHDEHYHIDFKTIR